MGGILESHDEQAEIGGKSHHHSETVHPREKTRLNKEIEIVYKCQFHTLPHKNYV